MRDWSDIWHVADLSYLARLFFSSYVTNHSDFVSKTVDSVISNLTWVLEHSPARAFLALDSGSSERKLLDPLYKIGRPSPPPEYFGCYEAILDDIWKNFGDTIEIVSSDGWEADDVMATIARSARELGMKAIVMANDKDLRQVLRPGSVVMQLRKRCADGMGAEWKFFNTIDAEVDWQCFHTQFIDFQTLVGDEAVDRIRGCPGVGPKTASELLMKYVDVPTMKNAEIPGKLGENLKSFWKEEPLTRSLVTLRDQLEIRCPVTQEITNLKSKRRI